MLESQLGRLECSLERLNRCSENFAFEVNVVQNKGRCCIATKSICRGETLAFDPPLLYWEDDELADESIASELSNACNSRVHANVVNLLAEYIRASEATRLRVDDFAVAGSAQEARYIQDKTLLWATLCTQIWERCSAYHEQLRSVPNMVALLTKSHINAHGFNEGHAMLEIASKSNHACSPNATYVPVTVNGHKYMRLFAIKPIFAGDEILTTYIAGLDMLSSTRIRRALLIRQKAFVCRCKRCVSPDWFSTLPCPACQLGTIVWHDEVEQPWICSHCRRRFWDGQVTRREKQLGSMLANIDSQMNRGVFPPLSIMAFLMKDVQEDLGKHHHLQIQAWSLLEELLAYRHIIGLSDDSVERPMRLANAWKLVRFLLFDFWDISPVVATNLAVLRLRTLLTHGNPSQRTLLPPPGLSFLKFMQALKRAKRFLVYFFGDEDADAHLFHKALQNYSLCAACSSPMTKQLNSCPKCTLGYCSRRCVADHRENHAAYCVLAQKTCLLIHDTQQFLESIQ
jgi:hypothetical protein